MDQQMIDRPPRIQPELPAGTYEIPKPPNPPSADRMRLIQIGLPLLTVAGYVLVSSFGSSGRSSWMIIPMALTIVASIVFSWYSYRKERRRAAELVQEYIERLIELNKEMHTAHDLQRRFYVYNYPDVAGVARIIPGAGAEPLDVAPRRPIARLWERRTSDHDFGIVRLGIGTRPSTVIYELRGGEDQSSVAARAALKLAADSRFVNDVPVILNLRLPFNPNPAAEPLVEGGPPRVPFVHALGVAGTADDVYPFIRALLLNFVVFHAPSDARLYILGGQRNDWAWAQKLPHCRNDQQTQYICLVEDIGDQPAESALDDDDGDSLDRYLEGLRRLLAQRKIRLEEHEENTPREDPTLPFCLMVVDLLDVVQGPATRLDGIETSAALSILLAEGARLGAAVIFLVPNRSKVPDGCTAALEIERSIPPTNSQVVSRERISFRYIEAGLNGSHSVGVADMATKRQTEGLAGALEQLMMRLGSGAALESSVPLLDLLGYRDIDDLTTRAALRWQASTEPRYSNWLQVKIGRMPGNKPRRLVFSAKRDGVHGMVAGSTGSGKSELLISLIVAMAATYSPSVLNFVLVDYKGGGAFNEFKRLPHCVDVITNLAGDGITRMFTAIGAELNRRQKLNTDTSTKNIVEYRKQGLHQTQPYPFLFIIIDEFAEMITDRAEYKSELERITRVGRAQGVSLILAAQRPSGVTDQMRSNIKLRICLRVETSGESREMLRRADAAFLPSGLPGRGYVQVGNEEVELIQVAYSGESYQDQQGSNAAPVIWPERGGRYDPAQDQAPLELYKVIVERLRGIADAGGSEPQYAPWPDFLPTQLALSQTLIAQDPQVPAVTDERYLRPEDIAAITLGMPPDAAISLNPTLNRWLNDHNGWNTQLDWAAWAMRPVIGLIDHPAESKQMPLVVDLRHGHVAVFGASGSGKTTWLRTLVVSLAATHAPDQLHMYVLDLGGRNLTVLGDLPHVGAVIIPDEEGYQERVQQVLREIGTMIEDRKRALSLARAEDVYAYNLAHPANVMPAVLLVIDNFVEFIETFGVEKDNVESVLSGLVGTARQSKPYGIHVVIAINRLADLSSQLLSIFTERYALHLADPTDYRTLVGSSVSAPIDLPGRGYVRVDRFALSFQTAIPIDLRRGPGGEPANELQMLELLFARMHKQAEASIPRTQWPIQVGALPKDILLKKLLGDRYNLELDADFLRHLRDRTREVWKESRATKHAEWLRVLLGVSAGGKPLTLHLSSKEDGVHGMIAGGTGSGKSELMMTLIVSLALRYDPSMLNLVLVDYKGGGAFTPFEKLPHCVQTLTNLNVAAVRRMFTSISAEMRRRQALNTQTGVADIVEYHRKGLHHDKPYPFLFIIIDEYAELISSSPEFGAELDSITRLGRALGVLLLLAAQRPTGVSDQMRANIKYRICLRVEQADTSRELLRRSDAAMLPNGMPGRGYLQIGNDPIKLIQVAYTGEAYPFAPPNERGERPKFFDVIVQMARELHGDQQPRTPWPPELSAHLTMADTLPSTYLERDSIALLTLGRGGTVAVNPFVQAWLDGVGAWPGIDWRKTALQAVAGLIDDPAQARQRPLAVDFNRGHAVVFGTSGSGKTTFLRSLIVSLAATHAPDELHVHIFDLGGHGLEMLDKLPQVGTLVMPDERGYEERVQQLLRELGDELDRRKLAFSTAQVTTLAGYNTLDGVQRLPAIVLVIDNIADYIETFSGGRKQDDENNLVNVLIGLLRQGRSYGLHVIITATRLNVLSSKFYSLFTERYALRLTDSSEYSGVVGANMPDVGELIGRGYTRVDRTPLVFQVALLPGTVDSEQQVSAGFAQIKTLAEQMAANLKAHPRTYPAPLEIGALPKESLYNEVLARLYSLRQEPGVFLDDLKARMAEHWARARTAEHAEWLQVPLGAVSGNQIRTLQLEARKDGVHGMIAGGTGSGKSELLMTLIVGLSLHYPPDILNFVLVDYKGGGAFQPFEQLPHCVDVVTNLNPAAVDRMFTSIRAEINRRQALNVETKTKDIIDYRRKGKHLGENGRRYPHLFIIIDEYAEMIQDNPDHLHELESITRVGRSLGVSLLLASQQPKGVTDQMRANIKYRICLRVEQADTSRELLRRPDAAYLPSDLPGRGYLQVGNEQIELIQVAYSGKDQPDDRASTLAERAQSDSESAEGESETPKFFDMVVRLAREQAGDQAVPRPWPAFLPEQFTLETTLHDAQHQRNTILGPALTAWLTGATDLLWPPCTWAAPAEERLSSPLRPAVGLVDDPANARQFSLVLDLSRSQYAVFGEPGSGKSVFLRTICAGLVATHSPDDLHLYAIDLGGRRLRALEELPHTGAIIYADEDTFDEKLQRLLDLLDQTLTERQQLFSEKKVGNLWEYNERYPAQALPALVTLIDNFAELKDRYEGLVEGALTPLIRNALSAGISFVITANTPSNLTSRLYSLLTERLTFRQTDPDRYLDIVGRGARPIADLPGRGYLSVEGRPLVFQAALPLGLPGDESRAQQREAEEWHHLSERMQQVARERGRRQEAPRIEALPQQVSLQAVLGDPEVRPEAIEALIGINNDFTPAGIDLQASGPHALVIGPPRSGKSTVLYNWALSLAMRYPPARLLMIVIDFQGRFVRYGGENSLLDLPQMIENVTDIEQLEAMQPRLEQTCSLRAKGEIAQDIYVLIDNLDDLADELGTKKIVEELGTLIRRYRRDGLHVIATAGPRLGLGELRRRISASNFGLALRTEEPFQILQVGRTPQAVRGRELPVGRGFLVRSGQPAMVQVANFCPDGGSGDEAAWRAQALDEWVAASRARFPGQKAEWPVEGAEGSPAARAANAAEAAARDALLNRMFGVVRKGIQYELRQVEAGHTNGSLLSAQFMNLSVQQWQDEAILTDLLRELYIREQVRGLVPEADARAMASQLDGKTLADLLGSPTRFQ